MRKFIILMTLLISNQTFSQKTLFDTLTVNSKTKIIGRYPQYDKNKSFEKYNFIIEDSTSIVEFIKTLKLGDEVKNSLEDPCFKLTVVKNYDEIGSWTINPNLKSAMTHDGHTYKFDLNQISKLNETHPFKYSFEIKSFSSKSEYGKYLAQQKNNPNFLFDYSPQFRYEGSFEIEFKKSEKFPHPKGISEYLKPYIEKIANEDEYSLGYIVNEKNMKNREQYTMTISGSKKLFTELKLKNLKNENWQPIVEEGYFFYKK
ncbi:hypothetical protein FSS13T_10670 [Flavobacterium saliperosum S13]|uniref:Uncharacterized protein n=2 Tax=Flavobacterium saliperosum TaxID=329186 RepID=A0A1G4VY35_9FLAO|nr:hypothetical protein [Flavobacterium saliperosum]ESU26896.1 hypothetical protein FSS13T_10670 [Flavobacterium saliperosum S13]SCX13685.1 hypothetical protein SAMN02927925_01998 [Flavobacterium saliperosum]